jgi:hypothetical protein
VKNKIALQKNEKTALIKNDKRRRKNWKEKKRGKHNATFSSNELFFWGKTGENLQKWKITNAKICKNCTAHITPPQPPSVQPPQGPGQGKGARPQLYVVPAQMGGHRGQRERL